jgi:hypothetical protein
MDSTGKSAERRESLQSPLLSSHLLTSILADLSTNDDRSNGSMMEISDTI